MGQRKSEYYNWFNSSNSNKKKKNTPKKVLKTSFRISKILAYTFLFGISLAGCAQSIVIKTDTNTGSGLEFYESKNEVSPHVLTLKETSKIYQDANSSQKIIGISKKNYWVRDSSVLNKLRAQEPNLGNWRSKTQSFRIEDKNQTIVQSQTKQRYYVINNNDKFYTFVNPVTTKINFLSLTSKNKKLAPTIQDLLNNNSKWEDWAGQITTKSDTIQNIIGDTSGSQTVAIKDQGNDKLFSLDAYAYLQDQYLKNIPTIQTKGKIDDKTKAWFENYFSITTITGWANNVDESKTPVANNFIYNPKSALSFDSMKEQRAIYSWKGAWHLGPFYALFVYPLAQLTSKIIGSMPQISGWEAIIAILLIVLLVRSIAYALSFKSTLQMVKQQEIQAKVAVINAKYEPYKGNKQMDRRKQQEIQELYKKEGISMFGAFAQIFITMPLFLSMWRVIGATPDLKSTTWLGINFALTSYRELFGGAIQYLPLMIICAGLQAWQVIMPRLLTKRRERHRVNIYQKQALKKSNKTQNIMLIVFVVMALGLPAGLQVYWIFTALYAVMQNTINHYVIKYQSIHRKAKPAY